MKIKENELVKANIDYLKVTFYFDEFEINNLSKLDLELLDLLKVDPIKFEEVHRVRNYKNTYLYDEGICIGIDPINKGFVEEYVDHFCLELSGATIHQLEEKGVDILEILKFCNRNVHKVNRIDIAVDDFGIMNIETLKRKIKEDIYVSNFRAKYKGGKRSSEIENSNYDEIIQDFVEKMGYKPILRDTRTGYSATWGSKTNGATELQFYDKVAEKNFRGAPVGIKQWNRFEMRFGVLGKRGDLVLKKCIESIEKKEFGMFAKSLLHGIIEFKEIPINKDLENLKKNKNMNDCPIWRDYKKFLNGAGKIKIPYLQSELERSVERSINWTKKDWTSTLIKFAITGHYDLDKQGLRDFLENKDITFNLLAEARNYLMRKERKIYTDEELLQNLQCYINSYLDSEGEEINVLDLYTKRLERNKFKMIPTEKLIDYVINGDIDEK